MIVLSLLFGNKKVHKRRSHDPKTDPYPLELRADLGTHKVLLIHPNFPLHKLWIYPMFFWYFLSGWILEDWLVQILRWYQNAKREISSQQEFHHWRRLTNECLWLKNCWQIILNCDTMEQKRWSDQNRIRFNLKFCFDSIRVDKNGFSLKRAGEEFYS